MESDDFDRAGELGAEWTMNYHGYGAGTLQHINNEIAKWNETLGTKSMSLTLRDESKAFLPPVIYGHDGKQIPFGDTCAACHKRWAKDDVAFSEGGAPFRHRDCARPQWA